MKKLIKFGVVISLLCLFTGCSGGDKLKNFSEEQLKVAAMEAIDLFKDGKYDEVVDRFADEIRGNLSGDELKKAWDENFIDAGSFVEYSDFSYSEKDENGFVVVITNYENNKIQYTLSFNKDMKLTNFFMK